MSRLFFLSALFTALALFAPPARADDPASPPVPEPPTDASIGVTPAPPAAPSPAVPSPPGPSGHAAKPPHDPMGEACAPGWESRVFASTRGAVVRITDGEGWGAGFVWKTARHVVTAMHVVDGAQSLEVIFEDGSAAQAHVVAGDRATDLAILELESGAPTRVPLKLGDPASLPVGSPLVAVGHPFAGGPAAPGEEGLREWTITRGVLGAKNDHQIQFDAQINPGNSGGPILDCTGRVLGVASRTKGTIGFAGSATEILALDRSGDLPGISFAPEWRLLVGPSWRVADFASYGPHAAFELRFFRALQFRVRAAGLVSLASETDGERVITSRGGGHASASVGHGVRVWKALLVPQIGVTGFWWRESAFDVADGRAHDASTTLSSLRFTPGIGLHGRFVLDYLLEVDTTAFADSAHVLSLSMPLPWSDPD